MPRSGFAFSRDRVHNKLGKFSFVSIKMDMGVDKCAFCNREPVMVLCVHCGHTFTGRVRMACMSHPQFIHLMDTQYCPECKRTELKECDYHTNNTPAKSAAKKGGFKSPLLTITIPNFSPGNASAKSPSGRVIKFDESPSPCSRIRSPQSPAMFDAGLFNLTNINKTKAENYAQVDNPSPPVYAMEQSNQFNLAGTQSAGAPRIYSGIGRGSSRARMEPALFGNRSRLASPQSPGFNAGSTPEKPSLQRQLSWNSPSPVKTAAGRMQDHLSSLRNPHQIDSESW